MNPETPRRKVIKFTCKDEDTGTLIVDTIAKNSDLSKSLIKKLMVNGSVFQTFKSNRRRVRKAKNTNKSGDLIECFYDPSIDFDRDFTFNLLHETANYGIYHKPAGARSEGTNYGDKTSLIRHVEKLKRYVFLINRLDMEVEGLVVVAYNSKTQNLLQQMWRNDVVKKYQGIVFGHLEDSGTFEEKINNKFAKTTYRCIKQAKKSTYVEIELATERKNQIRIHFSNAGHPVMGDPLYGENNKNKREGIKLLSYALEFEDPHTQKKISISIPEENMLF